MNLYSLYETQMVGDYEEKEEDYDLITVGMICLGDTEDEKCKGLIKMLSILLSSEMEVEDKKRRLSDEFEIAMTKEMESEALNMCDYSKMVEDKGIIKGILQSLKNLIKNSNMTIEQAMETLEIPEKERAMYTAKLSK